MSMSEFYEALPPKCCDTCGALMEEMADCYSSTCTTCQGLTFYPLSPVGSPMSSSQSAPRLYTPFNE